MGIAAGFAYQRRKSGEVVITHDGRVASVLRGDTASRFLAEIAAVDDTAAQELMARLTGNYRRGNERQAARHPRNRR